MWYEVPGDNVTDESLGWVTRHKTLSTHLQQPWGGQWSTGSETRQIENHFITPTTNLEHIWWWQKLPWWCYRSLPACPCESCGCVWHVLCLVSRSICQNIFNIKFKYHLRGKYHHHQRLVNFPKPSGETVWLTWFYWRFWAIIPHLHFLIGALPPSHYCWALILSLSQSVTDGDSCSNLALRMLFTSSGQWMMIWW